MPHLSRCDLQEYDDGGAYDFWVAFDQPVAGSMVDAPERFLVRF